METRLEEISGKEKEFKSFSGSIVKSINEKLKEIEEKEKQLNLKEKELELENKKVGEIYRGFEADKERLVLREKQFEERWRELELYAVEFEANGDRVAVQLRDLELKDVQFKERMEEIEQIKKKSEADGKKLEERIHGVDRKEKQLGRVKGQHEFESNKRKIEADCKKLDERIREVCHREKQLDERVKGFDLGSKDLERQHKELASDKRKIKGDWKKLDGRIREVDHRERQLNERVKGFDLRSKDLERQLKDLESDKRKIEADWKKLDERNREVDHREKQLYERVKGFDLRSKDLEKRQHKEFESNKRKIEADWKKLDERTREVDHRERGLDRRLSDLEREHRELESNKRKLEADRKKLEERFCEGNSKERKLDSGLEVLEIGNKDLGRQHKELESDKSKFEADMKKLDEQLCEVEVKDKKSDEAVKDVEFRRKELEGQFGKLESDKREFKVDREKLDHIFIELKKKIKKFEENSQELESSKRELGGWLEQVKLMENSLDVKSKEIELKLNKYEKLCNEILMGGKTLQIFLNECWKDHENMGDGVSVLLRLSQDPAKLVLDALEGFFPPHLRKGDVEFAGHIVQSSCILLLENLLKISPDLKLKPVVKTEASILSFVWITKLKANNEHFMEILGFLLVLGIYDLASNFNLDELFNYVKTVAHYEQVPELCRLLGMEDKIPGLIQDLVERKQHLVAIRYAFAFNLVEKFPPDSLLKDHMEISNIESAAIIESGKNSPGAQSQATTRMVSDLRDAIRCIEDYNISSEYSLANLGQAIASLEKQEAKLTEEALSGDTGVKKCAVHVPSTSPAETTSKACKMVEKAPAVGAPVTPQPQQTATDFSDPTLQRNDLPDGLVDATSDVQHQAISSTEDPLPKRRKLLDGKNISTEDADSKPEEEVCGSDKDLRALLCQNLDFSLVRDKVAEILRSSSNPAISVFHAMKSFLPNKQSSGGISECSPEAETPINSCISLLRELKGVSYAIEACTIEEAREFSASWQAILKGKKGDHMQIACFLLFVDAYQLSSRRAVIPLINSLHCSKQLHNFFDQIGMPDFLPDLVKSLIAKNNRIQAIGYIHALNLRDRFPIVPLLDEHLARCYKFVDERYKGPNLSDSHKMKAINNRLDAVKAVMRLVKQCNLESEYPTRQLEKTLNELLQLRRSSSTGGNQPIDGGRKRKSDREEDTTTSASASSSSSKPPKSKWQKKRDCCIERFDRSQFEDYNRIGFAPHHLLHPLPPRPSPYPWPGFCPPPPPPNHFGQGPRGYGGYAYWCGFPGGP